MISDHQESPKTQQALPDPSNGVRRILVTGGSGFIGSNLLRHLTTEGLSCANVDIAAPDSLPPDIEWLKVDVRDRDSVLRAFAEYQPTDVIHLAARVDIHGKDLEAYRSNTEGTQNILDAVTEHGVSRTIVASTQFVCRPGHVPKHDQDYSPHTAYGASKVDTERRTRSAELPGAWTIIRPTTIWGPGDLRYRHQFYKVMSMGLYMHPSGPPALRSYGFVGNVVNQVSAILVAQTDSVHQRTLYVGDPVAPITEFVDEFARQLSKPVRRVPRVLVRGLAEFGELATPFGLPFPITRNRYLSMIENYPVPIDETFELLGPPTFTVQDGVNETVEWLRSRSIIS